MIGVTIRQNEQPDQVEVNVWEACEYGPAIDVTTRNVPLDDLRDFVGAFAPDEIWQDGDEMEFCFTPNCYELVRKDDPCPLCEGCLAEYQQEQLDYRATGNLRAYAGVIG
jgi:hypothetical protein